MLRAIDKFDRLGREGVEQLLGAGRKDESGDYTEGAKLEPDQIARILDYVTTPALGRAETLAALRPLVAGSATGEKGLDELARYGRGADRRRLSAPIASSSTRASCAASNIIPAPSSRWS